MEELKPNEKRKKKSDTVNDIGPVVDIVKEYPYSFHIGSARKRESPLA